MATTKYDHTTTGCGFSGRVDEGGFRLWTAFSDGALRRRIVDALVCGASAQRRKQGLHRFEDDETTSPPSPPPTPTLESKRRSHGNRLVELFRKEEAVVSDQREAEIRRKKEELEDLQAVVKGLQRCYEDNDSDGQRRQAAMDIRMRAKDDARARETLAILGAIPPLVAALESSDVELLISSLYALLNLSIGNDMNKSAIVNAGAIRQMQNLITTCKSNPNQSLSEAIVANFLGLSALDANKHLIGSSLGIIPFLLANFRSSTSSSQTKQDSLRALFNLSLAHSNTPHFLSSGVVPAFLASIGDMDSSDRVLAVLSNLISTTEGRRAVASAPDVFPILVDVLNWSDSPPCQENAAYILMVLAHKSCSNRAVMVESGVVSALLELSLLGTALAQRRASRILECLRVDEGKQLSEGFDGGGGAGLAEDEVEGRSEGDGGRMSEERKAVRRLVQMSLQSNLRRIVRRANLPGEFAPSDHLRSIVAVGSSSRSLPL